MIGSLVWFSCSSYGKSGHMAALAIWLAMEWV